MQTRRSAIGVFMLAQTVVLAAFLGGCLERKLKPLNPCLVSGVVAEVSVKNVDKVDLLFVVDDSQSMEQEQALLRDQFPNIIRTLTSGTRSDGSMFSPAKDLHLGVVSTDMGVPGITVPPQGCGLNGLNGSEFGDDGIMNNVPDSTLAGCPAQPFNERFLRYTMGVDDPNTIATYFGCIASLGIDGCGYEQQLEAGLKALWPSIDIDPATGNQWIDPDTGAVSNRILFLGNQQGEGTLGHGDAANDGFLRDTAVEGLSLVAVVVVTDEEDCSSANPEHLIPAMNLQDGVKYKTEPQNLRCHLNPQNLYLTSRYVEGFQELRPNNKELVIFAAITGVPEDLVTPQRLEMYDFEDANSRAAFYNMIESDTRMQATINAAGDNLVPSCEGDVNSRAYPPRRIVEVAKGFGANGIVQSICQADFSPAVNAIIDIIAKQLGAVCLPRQLVRNSKGLVGCNVVWELPLPNSTAPATVPRECAEAPTFLTPPPTGEAQRTRDGRARCVVTQLPVMGRTEPMGADGWFYDDFSETTMNECKTNPKQRVAFTPTAKPGTGVTVQLECLSEVQTVAVSAELELDLSQESIPKIGDSCEEGGDAACAIRLRTGQMDNRLFCHRDLNVCVLSCASAADCPAAWVCDKRDQTQKSAGGEASPTPICVNPTCGTGE